MASFDELQQKIMLDGDKEVVEQLREIGEKGSEYIEKLCAQIEKGVDPLEAFAKSIGTVVGAIAGLAGAVTAWAEANNDAIQKTNQLADAFGASAGEIAGIEGAFAKAGVGAKQFEQFAQRLTVTIARYWPSIQQSVETSATAQESANERVEASILKVQEAQANLALVDEQTASKIANAKIHEEEAHIKLQFAAQEAYQSMVKAAQDYESASLGVEAAEQRLAALQGHPVSAAEKQSLEIKQAQLALDKAREQEQEALTKKQQEAAERQVKAEKVAQEARDAALKSETVANEAAVARQKAELAVKEAVTQRAEAEQKAADVALKSVPKIAEGLEAIVQKNQGVAKSFDFAAVSVQNLIKGLTLAASVGGKEPTGMQVMHKLMELLKNDTEGYISQQQRLAIVQQLSQRGFSATSSAAFELLNALKDGPELLEKMEQKAEKMFWARPEGKENVENFRKAVANLGFQIDMVNRNLTAAAAPYFAAMMNAIANSIENSDGILHNFIEGLQALGHGLVVIGEYAREAFKHLAEAMNISEGKLLLAVLTALGVAVAAFGGAWVAIPGLIAAVVYAIGYVSEHLKEAQEWVQKNWDSFKLLAVAVGLVLVALLPWTTAIAAISAAVLYLINNWDKVKEAVADAWKKFKDTSVYKFLEGVAEKLKGIWDWAKKIGQALGLLSPDDNKSSSGDNTSNKSSSSSSSSDTATEGFASGGYISGPGSGTSDSILARLSNGEYVMKAAAVSNFGVDFFHALNNMMLPGFAVGGLVGGPSRMAGASSVQASRPLNLTIDGHTFNGLRGPKSVVDSLATYAVARQTASAGTKPSWVR